MRTCLSDYCRFNTNKMDDVYEGRWIGKMTIVQQKLDKETYMDWFDTDLIKYDELKSCLKSNGEIPIYYLNKDSKDVIRKFLLDIRDPFFLQFMPKFSIQVTAELDECEIDFDLLDEDTQKEIIDAMLYENLLGGNLKIPVEFFEEEEDAEMSYRHHINLKGYIDETFGNENSEYEIENS